MEPIEIDPSAYYHDGDVRLKFGFTSSALKQARKSKALKFSRRGRVLVYRGSWLIDWLNGEPASEDLETAHV